MKTAKEILHELADKEGYLTFIMFTKIEDITLKAMESYASQSVEAERKRIHDNDSDMDLEAEAEKWYYSVYNRKRPLFSLSEQQSPKQFFKVMADFARTILSRNENINPPKTETNETD